MSGLPTLLKPGYIIPPRGLSRTDKKNLKNIKSIEFVLKFLEKRIPIRGGKIKLTPRKYGDKVIVLKSDTGSGKSTVLPAELFTTFSKYKIRNIIVTQPRVLTAVDMPEQIVPHYADIELDKNIGYHTQDFKRLPSESGIIFCTIGVLTRQLITMEDEDFMKKYQFIIIDEVHERDIQTDICLFLLKKFLQNNWKDDKCPIVILTSATFDKKVFMNYYGVPSENFLQVIGKTYPINEYYPPYDIQNYTNYALAVCKEIHIENISDITPENKFRDIIIFVHSTALAEKIYKNLMYFNTIMSQSDSKIEEELQIQKKIIKKGGNGNGDDNAPITLSGKYILPIILNSERFRKSDIDYQNLFSDIEITRVPIWKKGVPHATASPTSYAIPSRRVVLATPVAETGLTIETLKYCIDTGYRFSIEFKPDFTCNMMALKNVTQGSAIQRKGRVGRKSEGHWYPCYTKQTFENLSEDMLSQIILIDPTTDLLSILVKENNCEILTYTESTTPQPSVIFKKHTSNDQDHYYLSNQYNTNFKALDFIELPSSSSLSYSIEKLHILGFIDDRYDVTPLGYIANMITFIDLESRRMIMSGFAFGANVLDLITIAAFLFVQKRNIFEKDFTMGNFMKLNPGDFEFFNRMMISDDFINCLFIWNMFNKYIYKELMEIGLAPIKKALNMENAENWCKKMKLKFDGLLLVILRRDDIIDNMLNIGLNPYYNGLGIDKSDYNLNKIIRENINDGLIEVRKLKRCIMEGFKCNILQLQPQNNEDFKPIARYNLLLRKFPVNIRSIYVDRNQGEENPRYLLTSGMNITQSRGMSGSFEVSSSDYVSVLDNFIDVDISLFN
jgi:HrpA-like RNA helicase